MHQRQKGSLVLLRHLQLLSCAVARLGLVAASREDHQLGLVRLQARCVFLRTTLAVSTQRGSPSLPVSLCLLARLSTTWMPRLHPSYEYYIPAYLQALKGAVVPPVVHSNANGGRQLHSDASLLHSHHATLVRSVLYCKIFCT